MISIVIPIYNEALLIDDLVNRTVTALERWTTDYELLFVDDGSEDRSLTRLLEWQQKNQQIKVLALSKNFGHQAAFTAGLEHAKGEYVGLMDGDLQDPPELFEAMYRKLTEEGFDVISGKRTGRRGKNSHGLLTALFHLLFRNLAVIRNMENTGNFSMLNRKALKALLRMPERVRYLPGLRTFIGFKQGFVEFVRDERSEGSTKMSFSRLFHLATDAIFSFSRFPIRMCLTLGLFGTVVFMAAGIYVLVAKIAGFAIPGWSSTLLSIYFLGSIQLVFLGVVGEYVYRIYKEAQNRPIYLVDTFYDGSEPEK